MESSRVMPGSILLSAAVGRGPTDDGSVAEVLIRDRFFGKAGLRRADGGNAQQCTTWQGQRRGCRSGRGPARRSVPTCQQQRTRRRYGSRHAQRPAASRTRAPAVQHGGCWPHSKRLTRTLDSIVTAVIVSAHARASIRRRLKQAWILRGRSRSPCPCC